MKQTHKTKILEYLSAHGSITPAEAFMKLGIYRLGARVFDLRRLGYPISTTMEYVIRDGEQVKYARYSLSRQENVQC